MRNELVLAFTKNAAAYFEQANDTVNRAYELLGNNEESREQLSAVNPAILNKLASLTRFNGSAFLPDGMEKQAEACLSSHQTTARLLDQVLDEYAIVKQAYDQLTSSRPSLGSVSADSRKYPTQTKQAYTLDSDEAPLSFRNFTERVLNS
ncbi:MAG: hypothetical protein LBL62_02305 [Planctomycetaceae bacterium]|jgi:hypothetical protein|nr:hypothetical protein [Planctomycetaceae bacterium]